MPDYDNRNRFTLFRNNKKREGKRDADFNGTFTDADGREYWINAWSQTPKNGGEKFLSGDVRPKVNDVPKNAGVLRQAAQAANNLDDEMPF
jgi:hypothetical protein